MKLTLRRIETLGCPAGKKDALVFDDEQKGLAVRVTASGGKSYLAQYTLRGRGKRRIPLGSVSAISLDDARKATAAIRGEVATGKDPAAERKAAVTEAERKAVEEAFTLDALLTKWAASHLTGRRTSYAGEAVRALRYAFKAQLAKPAAELRDKAVARVLEGFASAGRPAMAASTMSYGRAAFGWAIGRRLIVDNPFAGLSFGHVVKRERVLKDHELRAIWQATAGTGVYNAIVRTSILTGQRREEVAGMVWSELSDDLSTWTIAADRSKNGASHVVPLSLQAQKILKDARPRAGLVFPGERGLFNGWSKSKDRLDRDSGVTDWRLHDIRRTVATGLQALGVRLEVTEAVLNHISGSRAGIVGVYQRHSWAEEKRAALNGWGAHVGAIVEGREGGFGNVTPIRARPTMRHDSNRANYAGSLDEEQRRRVKDCLVKDGLSLPSDHFERFISDIEASIADYLPRATAGSFRDIHDALRALYNLAEDDDPQIGVLRSRIKRLPRGVAEYVNERWPGVHSSLFQDEPNVAEFEDWAQTAAPEDLTRVTRAITAQGAQVVEGRSRGNGKRSARQLEPTIMGETRGAGSRTHRGGRRNSAEEQDLVMQLTLVWADATGQVPTAGRSEHRGFGDLVHSVFQWVGLPDGSAAYALRQYWAEVAKGPNARGTQETA
jgi:integrase